MVVKYFEKYLENCAPEVLVRRNLRELIEEEVKNGCEPTIIFDISSAFFMFLSGRNRQPKILKNNIENFVKNVASYGANLIVIGRGNIENITSWHRKNSPKFKNLKEEFERASENDENENYISVHGTSFCCSTSFAFISNKSYKFHTSIRDVHLEAAELAATKNCLAVMGQDSNYLIYEGIRNYIPLKGFDIRTFDCYIYDRQKLLDHLGLMSYHLPLFATLCGNNIVPVDYLYQFHKKLSSGKDDKFICLAKFVSKTTSDPYKHVEDIVRQLNNPKICENLLTKSLDMYLKYSSILPEVKSKLEFAVERKLQGDWCKTLYNIYTLKEFRNFYFTGFDADSPTSEFLLRPLREKIYGIIFYEDKKPIVKEWCQSEIQADQINKFLPVLCTGRKPKCEHPGLIRLWDKSTPNLSFLKWNLFCSSISETLNYSTVRNLNPKILLPVLALHYLETQVPIHFGKKFFKKKYEMEAFLMMALLVSSDSYDPLEVQKLDSKTKICLRLRYLSVCFIDTCFVLNILNEACGLVSPKSECCICNYYDEILLNFVYEKLKGGTEHLELLNENPYLEIAFSTLIEIILTGF